MKYKKGDKVLVSKKFVNLFPETTGGKQKGVIIDVLPYLVCYKIQFNSHALRPWLFVEEKFVVDYQKPNWFQKLFSR